eukprot:NODE_1063_length_1029_cov_13.004435_g1018_i0.p1 GENE.NODE_1063_length_1029_cov_13.004435_g1018_i0~~NODE_1063_length_1029_cov_13.004435_g1018_i0.p1  ORF type:complete len:326 (-),score=26.93 NODE_1063_length_1029_cov_13.004435_g1018_i0:3-980(-)
MGLADLPLGSLFLIWFFLGPILIGGCPVVLFPTLALLYGWRQCYVVADHLGNWMWKFLVWFIEVWGRHEVRFSGDDPPMHETVLILANHRFWLDFVVVFGLAGRKGRLGCMKIFAKDVIKWFPGYGWGAYFTDSIFLKRDWNKDQKSIAKTFSRLLGHKLPFWILTHAEGTRINTKKRIKSQQWAKSKGLPQLEHVLAPRAGAFIASCQGLRHVVDAVYDLTIVYEDVTTGEFWQGDNPVKGPSLWKTTIRSSNTYHRTHCHVKRYPMSDIPTEPNAITAWLTQRFVEKDKLIQHLLDHKSFPKEYSSPYVVKDMDIEPAFPTKS